MKTTTYTILALLAGAFIMNGIARSPAPAVQAAQPTSVHERVLQSGTIKCGYFEEAPFTINDPNTGELSGIAVELAEVIAQQLSVAIEWIPVSNFTTMTEDLEQGKFDAICASVFNLPRSGQIDYTLPYIYAPLYAYVATNNASEYSQFEAIDWAKTKIVGMDGEAATTEARERFKEAEFLILPSLSTISDMLASVATGKADVALVTATVFDEYQKTNPGQLQRVSSIEPFHVFPVSFGLKTNEPAFKNTLDIIVRNMQASGKLNKIIDQHDAKAKLLRPQRPYS